MVFSRVEPPPPLFDHFEYIFPDMYPALVVVEVVRDFPVRPLSLAGELNVWLDFAVGVECAIAAAPAGLWLSVLARGVLV